MEVLLLEVSINLGHCVPYITKVIKSEFCVPCGRRTKFGKIYLRCQDCRLVTHPECRDRCPMPCNPIAVSTPMKNTEVHFSHCFMACFHSFILYLDPH